MSFLYPYVLLALLAPVVLGGWALSARRRAGRAWRRLVSPAHEGELVCRRPGWRTGVPAALALLALACAIIALARPFNGFSDSGAVSTGRNLIIALDISRSMETQDVSPSRLEEARAAAYELIDALPGDKIGLMLFSGEADLVVPLTYDHTALRDALEQVNRGWAGAGGTNFGLVLRHAMQDFSRSAPDGTNALVILSDGEDTVDTSMDIAREARDKKLLVITVGIGTEAGGAIPDAKGENGLWQDAEGKHVISKLDVKSLRQFAEATGGDFFTMGSGTNLSEFARKAVNKLDRHEEVYSSSKTPNDLFSWFAGFALLLLTAAVLLGTDWKSSRRVSAILALMLAAIGSFPSQASPEEENVQAYQKALEAKSEGKDLEKVRTLLSQALLDEEPSLQAAAYLALGNLDTAATLDKLRALYHAGISDEGEAEDGDEGGNPSSAAAQGPSPEQLQGIVDELNKNLIPWQDALKADSSLSAAKKNISKIKDLIKVLEDEIKRLNEQRQEQQQSDKDNQQKPDKGDGEQDQQKPDKGDGQQDQQKPDGDDGQQDQQKPDGDDGQQDQQKPDGDDGQQDQQKPDKGDGGQDQQKPDKGDGEQNRQKPDMDDGKQDQQKPQSASPNEAGQQPFERQQSKLTDKEKARQRASGILQMHLDEEKGSPIPHFNDNARPPKKDY